MIFRIILKLLGQKDQDTLLGCRKTNAAMKTASTKKEERLNCSESGDSMSKKQLDENVFVQCPYYKHEQQSVIYCEGVEDNSSIHMAFASKTQKKEYEKRFCQNCWQDCLIACAQNIKWDYDF